MGARSLTIIIPCFNEEGNISDTLKEITTALDGIVSDYEMLVFNDCSTDGTKGVIDSLAQKYSNVKAIHNGRNMGIGYNYRQGVAMASKEYVILIPGDNEIRAESIREICRHIGEADMVIPYIANYWIRPIHRQILSKTFTVAVNAMCGQSLHYYNGIVLHRVAKLRSIELRTDGFAYSAEILVQLLRQGCSYIEVPMVLRPRHYGSSRALSRKNIVSVVKAMANLALSR